MRGRPVIIRGPGAVRRAMRLRKGDRTPVRKWLSSVKPQERPVAETHIAVREELNLVRPGV
jgi:hypothetical protein